MTEPHVITALVAKRAEIAGRIHALELQADALRVDLEHVDRVLMLYGFKGVRTIRPRKPVAPRLFPRRAVPLYLRELERDGITDLTAREIGLRLMEQHGMDVTDKALVEKAAEAVRSGRKALVRG